jgi:hypothetical protein
MPSTNTAVNPTYSHMTTADFQALVLSFPGVEAAPHFDRTAFRVIKKRIFASLHEPTQSANIALTPSEQAELCILGGTVIHPLPNKWGEQGWTTFDLPDVAPELVQAALELAYQAVVSGAPRK